MKTVSFLFLFLSACGGPAVYTVSLMPDGESCTNHSIYLDGTWGEDKRLLAVAQGEKCCAVGGGKLVGWKGKEPLCMVGGVNK
jgi:hypothetical protein